MIYTSSRNSSVGVSAAEAISQGISEDSGLFVPVSLPILTGNDFGKLKDLNYIDRAKYVLGKFLDDFTDEELDRCVTGAYSGNFDDDQPAPLKKLKNNKYMLELWHGPTCAFKDLALQLLPFLLTASVKKEGGNKKTVILVATSGDTGKAALEGFCDVEGTEIIVFYPQKGVSPMQKLQMSTQQGENVFVCAIEGNFDDAQTGVKQIFTNTEIAQRLNDAGLQFSSANSINWGRLVPQIVYYVSAYCDLLKNGEETKDGFNVVVPTGNFGNILAAFYAKNMGVPINRLICASNANNVLTEFINSGCYNKNRRFYTSISPSMDILISSNLERLLFEMYEKDSAKVKDLMEQLSQHGKYTVDNSVLEKIQSVFFAGCCDDEQTLKTIKKYFDDDNYLCDTHTAVALNVYEQFVAKTGDTRPTVIVSTASPYKFSQSVLKALLPEKNCGDEFEMVEALNEYTKVAVPNSIKKLRDAKVKFDVVCERQEMPQKVLDYLNIK
ncbi:MAG: threonine synthase [bacterium]|nr:threonine synthase [bacterium]